MGVYDEYGKRGIQLKVSSDGDLRLRRFKIGDKVPLTDGVYFGHEGVIVIVDGLLTAEFDRIIDKWGNPVTYKKWLELHSLVSQAVREIAERTKQKP